MSASLQKRLNFCAAAKRRDGPEATFARCLFDVIIERGFGILTIDAALATAAFSEFSHSNADKDFFDSIGH